MFPHVTPSKKIPRLLLAQSPKSLQALRGLELIWPDQSESAVFDLSFGGLVVAPQGHLGRVNPDKYLDLRLRIDEIEDPVPVKAKIAKISRHSVGLIFDPQLVDGRLVLEQILKDKIVAENLRESDRDTLTEALQGADIWLHGPFDTNVLIWKNKPTDEIQKAVIEYDNVIWIFDSGEVRMKRSLTATEENQGYFQMQNFSDPHLNKVSMGASWLDRCLRLLKTVNLSRGGDLSKLLSLLESQRAR